MCAHCSKRVEDGLSSLDEVSKVKVDLGRKEATIVCKSDVEIKDIEQKVKDKINELGFNFVSIE